MDSFRQSLRSCVSNCPENSSTAISWLITQQHRAPCPTDPPSSSTLLQLLQASHCTAGGVWFPPFLSACLSLAPQDAALTTGSSFSRSPEQRSSTKAAALPLLRPVTSGQRLSHLQPGRSHCSKMQTQRGGIKESLAFLWLLPEVKCVYPLSKNK